MGGVCEDRAHRAAIGSCPTGSPSSSRPATGRACSGRPCAPPATRPGATTKSSWSTRRRSPAPGRCSSKRWSPKCWSPARGPNFLKKRHPRAKRQRAKRCPPQPPASGSLGLDRYRPWQSPCPSGSRTKSCDIGRSSSVICDERLELQPLGCSSGWWFRQRAPGYRPHWRTGSWRWPIDASRWLVNPLAGLSARTGIPVTRPRVRSRSDAGWCRLCRRAWLPYSSWQARGMGVQGKRRRREAHGALGAEIPCKEAVVQGHGADPLEGYRRG